MQPRSPDFIGIGAQKAGTYWLRRHLARHPQIWMPPRPELHYFDRQLPDGQPPPPSVLERLEDPAWRAPALGALRSAVERGDLSSLAWSALDQLVDRDEAWYRMIFALAPATSLAGEITPRYAVCTDDEIAHMHALAPKAKLLFLLRHPVDRFWSQCLMKQADGSLPPGDPPAMRLFDTANGRPRGEYSKTILRYCRHFSPDQILLIFLDGVARDPATVLGAIQRFLGLPEMALDPAAIAQPVNQAAAPQPMPPTLRARIQAAYRPEMEILAEVLGGQARAWLGDFAPPPAPAPVLPLTASHVEGFRRLNAQPLGLRPRCPQPFFCLSMQRSGTTSVGDWLEAHGLARAGHPTSARLGWSLLWGRGELEAIFDSAEFQRAEILEDDPWWVPGFHRVLAERFPRARFLLLTRDPDAWFDSLCHHSGGVNPGPTDLHARIYGREEELNDLLARRPDLHPGAPGLLPLLGHRSHYTMIYRRHSEDVKAFFAREPERLFTGSLEAPETFHDLLSFVGLAPNPAIPIPRSNARTPAMAEQLAARAAAERGA
ncbi:MAG: sulfotransferase [Cyanobacteriota bacterium]